eukprot:GHVQ01018448.1.p1 GENE.GHVQ01018448.1~~GHVQ01018448.1.p1  ORF type:complete len:671 (+),score=54.00 GHVQ01018448.1:1172-3184(+)
MGSAVWRITINGREVVYAVKYNLSQEWHVDGSSLYTIRCPAVFVTDVRERPVGSHRWRPPAARDILRQIRRVIREQKGSVLIPVDCDSRLLELLLHLENFWESFGSNLSVCPVIFLSPVADTLLMYAKTMLEWSASRIRDKFLNHRFNPYNSLRHVKLITSLEEYMALPNISAVVLATPGSMNSGFSRALFPFFASDPRNLILFSTCPTPDSFAAWLLHGSYIRESRPLKDSHMPSLRVVYATQSVISEVPESSTSNETSLLGVRKRLKTVTCTKEETGAAPGSEDHTQMFLEDIGMPRRRRIRVPAEPDKAGAQTEVDGEACASGDELTEAAVLEGSKKEAGVLDFRFSGSLCCPCGVAATPGEGGAPRAAILNIACRCSVIWGFDGLCGEDTLRSLVKRIAPKRLILLPSSSPRITSLVASHLQGCRAPGGTVFSFWQETTGSAGWTLCQSVVVDIPMNECLVQIDEQLWDHVNMSSRSIPNNDKLDASHSDAFVAPLHGILEAVSADTEESGGTNCPPSLDADTEGQLMSKTSTGPSSGTSRRGVRWRVRPQASDTDVSTQAGDVLEEQPNTETASPRRVSGDMFLGSVTLRDAANKMKEHLPRQVFMAPQGGTLSITDKVSLSRDRCPSGEVWNLEARLDPSYFYVRRMVSNLLAEIPLGRRETRP